MDELIRRYIRRFQATRSVEDGMRLANIVSRLDSGGLMNVSEKKIVCITDYFSQAEETWMDRNYFMRGNMNQRRAWLIDLNDDLSQLLNSSNGLFKRLKLSIDEGAEYALLRQVDNETLFEIQTVAFISLLLSKDDRGLILNMYENINNFAGEFIYSFPRYLIDLNHVRIVKSSKPNEMPFIYKILNNLDYDFVLLNEE